MKIDKYIVLLLLVVSSCVRSNSPLQIENEKFSVIQETSVISDSFQGSIHELFEEDDRYSFIIAMNESRRTKDIFTKTDKNGNLVSKIESPGILEPNNSFLRVDNSIFALSSFEDSHDLIKIDKTGKIVNKVSFKANHYEGGSALLYKDSTILAFVTDSKKNTINKLYFKEVDLDLELKNEGTIEMGWHSIFKVNKFNNKIWLFASYRTGNKYKLKLFQFSESMDLLAEKVFSNFFFYPTIVTDSSMIVVRNNSISELGINGDTLRINKLLPEKENFKIQDVINVNSNYYVLIKEGRNIYIIEFSLSTFESTKVKYLYKSDSNTKNKILLNKKGNLIIYGARFNPTDGESVRRENPYFVEIEI